MDDLGHHSKIGSSKVAILFAAAIAPPPVIEPAFATVASAVNTPSATVTGSHEVMDHPG